MLIDLPDAGLISADEERGMARKFGLLLKSTREIRNISQSKLAEGANLDHSYVSRLESGTRMPTIQTLQSIIVVLNCDRLEKSRLLAAAGFAPEAPSVLLEESEPELADIVEVVTNPILRQSYDVCKIRRSLKALVGRTRLSIMGQQPKFPVCSD